MFISCRSAAIQSLSVDALVSELKVSLLFQDNSLVVLKEVWKIEGPHLCSLPKQALSVGEVCIYLSNDLFVSMVIIK